MGKDKRNFSRTENKQQGFTLIELLVVVVLIGIISSYVAISTGTNKSSIIEPLLENIRQSFLSASRHAILSGLPVGVVIDETELGFLGYSLDGWTAHDDETLQAIKLPEYWQMIFTSHSRIPELPEKAGENSETQKQVSPQPQLLFFPDGATSGATLEVVSEENDVVAGLEVSVSGRVKLLHGNAQDDS